MDLGASKRLRLWQILQFNFCWLAVVLQSPQDAHRSQLNIQPQSSLDALLFILLLYLLLLSDACSFVPIVTFHLSPSANVKASWISHSFFLGSINVWTATKYLVLCILDSLFTSCRTIKGNARPFEKAIEQMMITTTATHDDYPKYFDFFWCSWLCVPRMSFFLHRSKIYFLPHLLMVV